MISINGPLNITANGGSGRSSGGGGRIRFFYHQWNDINDIASEDLLIEVKGGTNCEEALACGQQGSVLTAPCPPGYQLDYQSFICIMC